MTSRGLGGFEPVLDDWVAACRIDDKDDFSRHVRIYEMERRYLTHLPMVAPQEAVEHARVKIAIHRAPAKEWTYAYLWEGGWQPLFDRECIHTWPLDDLDRQDMTKQQEVWITVDDNEFGDTLVEVASVL